MANSFSQLLIIYLTTPPSDFYLSKIVRSSSNPTLEPFTASELSLGSQSVLGVSMALSLQNISIQGLSNVQIKKNNGKPVITVNGNDVNFVAEMPNTEAPPDNVPNQLTISAGLLVVPDGTPSFKGGLYITIKSSELTGNFTATSSDGTAGQVQVNYTSLAIGAVADKSNITITLTLDSADSQMSPFISSILNQNAILSRIVSGVADALNQPNILQAISQYSTIAARNVLSA